MGVKKRGHQSEPHAVLEPSHGQCVQCLIELILNIFSNFLFAIQMARSDVHIDRHVLRLAIEWQRVNDALTIHERERPVLVTTPVLRTGADIGKRDFKLDSNVIGQFAEIDFLGQ